MRKLIDFSENEVHSAIYYSENEFFARRCRHYKAKESKAEWLGEIFSGVGKRHDERFLHQKWLN